MPDAPVAVVPAFSPSAPSAPLAVQAAGEASAPTVPGAVQAGPWVLTPATLETGSAEGNSGILWTAVEGGPEGNEISVEILTAASGVATGVSVTDGAIVVTPATKARLDVLTPSTGGRLSYAGVVNGRAAYAGPGVAVAEWRTELPVYPEYAGWYVRWNAESASASLSDVATPDLAGDWFPLDTYGATPDGVAASSADQVIAAVAASSAASALVTCSLTGASGGSAVGASEEAFLSGGEAGAAEPDAPEGVVGDFSPGTPTAPGGVVGAFSPGTPTAPGGVVGDFSPGTPTAPSGVVGAFSPGTPTAPSAVQP